MKVLDKDVDSGSEDSDGANSKKDKTLNLNSETEDAVKGDKIEIVVTCPGPGKQ